MNRYQWQADSAIAQVAIRRDQAYPTAYIVAGDGADASVFTQLPEIFRNAHAICVADTFEGKPALRVTGFEHDADVIGTLQRLGYANGTPQLTEREPDNPFHLGAWVQNNSVVAAGLTYLVADSLAFASGIVRKDKNNKAQGLLFASTSVLLTLFGTQNPRCQMEALYEKINEYAKNEGLDLDEMDAKALAQRSEHTSIIPSRLSHFLSEHLVAINNVGQGIGGYQGLRAGINQGNALKSASGVSIMVGQWGALGIEEDEMAGMDETERAAYKQAERDGKKPQQKQLDLLVDPVNWLRQKPLRLTGIGAGLHNVLTFGGGAHELIKLRHGGASKYQSATGAYMDMTAQVFNLGANALYGMSPKDRRGALKEEGYVDEITSMAAQMFAALPESERGIRMNQFSGYMAHMPELKSSAEELYQQISSKVEALEANPWHTAVPERTPKTQVTEPVSVEKLAEKPLELA